MRRPRHQPDDWKTLLEFWLIGAILIIGAARYLTGF
jgi:hypothetical protein